MIDGTGSIQLDSRLAKAQELMARGKQRQALDQLWAAEAVARGDADSLRRMSDVAGVWVFQQRFEPGQAPRLAQLVEVFSTTSRRRRVGRRLHHVPLPRIPR
jgi:hypothetical protein